MYIIKDGIVLAEFGSPSPNTSNLLDVDLLTTTPLQLSLGPNPLPILHYSLSIYSLEEGEEGEVFSAVCPSPQLGSIQSGTTHSECNLNNLS